MLRKAKPNTTVGTSFLQIPKKDEYEDSENQVNLFRFDSSGFEGDCKLPRLTLLLTKDYEVIYLQNETTRKWASKNYLNITDYELRKLGRD